MARTNLYKSIGLILNAETMSSLNIITTKLTTSDSKINLSNNLLKKVNTIKLKWFSHRNKLFFEMNGKTNGFQYHRLFAKVSDSRADGAFAVKRKRIK